MRGTIHFIARTAAVALASSGFVGSAIAAPPAIIVGAPMSLTGGFGGQGQLAIAGVEIAAEVINESGGIKSLGGAKLKVVSADTSSSDPTQAASVTRRLIQADHAVVLVGCDASTMTLAAQVEAERAQVPIVTASYADAIVKRGYKYSFKIDPPTSVLFDYMIDYPSQMLKAATGKTPKRFEAIVGSDASSQGMAAAVSRVAAAHHMEVAPTITFQNNLTDATPVMTAVLRNKPDLIVTSGFPQDTVLVLRSLRGVGVKTPVVTLSGSIGNNEMGRSLGDAAKGYFGLENYVWDLKTPGNAALVARYHKDFPHLSFPPYSEQFGLGYASVMLVKDALEKAGSADPRKVRDALASLEASATVLPGKDIKFDSAGLASGIVPVLAVWHDGVLRTVWPKEYQTLPPPKF